MLKSLNRLYKDRLDKVYEEAKHPRGPGGRWAAGGDWVSAEERRAKTPVSPEKLKSRVAARRRLMAMIDRGREKVGMKPQFKEEG